jgi:hypothetical protein
MNKPAMSNLYVTLAGFWQLARHWKQGNKAKLELSCENRSMEMHLSAVLGHPDHLCFPPTLNPPPPPSSTPIKRKPPSYLRWQERRRKAAEKASSFVHSISKSDKDTVESNLLNKVRKSSGNLKEVLPEQLDDKQVEKLADNSTSSSLCFKCDQCDYTNCTDKGLNQHVRMKHRISQLDGADDSLENSTTDKVVEFDLESGICPLCPENNDYCHCNHCDEC